MLMMRSFTFVKMLKQDFTCSVVTLACLVTISSHLSEVNLNCNNFVSSLNRRVINLNLALISISCVRRRASESSLVFSSSMLASLGNLPASRAARRNNCSSFQTQFSISHFTSVSFQLLVSSLTSEK